MSHIPASHQTQIPLPLQLADDSAAAIEQAAMFVCDSLLPHGHIFSSPGGHFTYRVVGPCCRLFDREELPWPCCRLQWRSKEPSWRRVGRRFVPDIAAKRSPSYQVEILNPEYPTDPIVLTMYWIKLSAADQQWWYTKLRAHHKLT